MGSGSTRPNTADDKMIAALERGDQGKFTDRKPPKIKENRLMKEKQARADEARNKANKLKALRLAAEAEAKAKKK
ncbi:hypothetical protein [Pseudemcibacter aquimaris]|uniref:hypothetical protein n=1 Tax=Pseudemcibacter aquimaris TaxID=2857064 RepID=UPI00201164B2|nr:hypothetical protein [Pseudemcibacter aquimaris]MCC3860117.1 hypothetical protein [Pseudemcibacter aquimaris]WDU57445.1 hypothetical protein KW060_09570 [Pseudemcibacter aquimaris]